ncbi:Putrescine-binding periplasmic protein SpuD [Paraburkholderia domus]|jgi:putrescine transport system substrate-binding protein|uniref:Putrescine-binding periplasmic protein n=2 Tax=Paraburkholderia domus TaxID=2793075 RepID=A0A9N8QYK3_9BURK|nr:polyamine ABC transporter substrate-binding protein [Burkholderia sp. R-70006]MBK5061220.1 polyamine ABC transporter substrate-binding protein [Burkholderia sp. R-70199]MBK5090694.1 polyamine ABC transporter substrate-binding protein [Burkholderia sp. R-69927]MBK5121051.1 polyamine ABC transporter substrate-binding protein [Burkholderia sp. R-69980]MBK5166415.1 polyamine ABC transporter substrate-binding protein [Burkholderia sp. R-70211]CAE6771930.1 Putrescine-binding periplasmic protein S
MKIRHAKLLSLTGTMLCSLTALTPMNAARAADTTINVYNWSDYIAKDTISGFEKQSGITVKYDSYDSDDTLQAKLLAGSSGYDIVVPTSSYMARQIEAGVYQKIDKSKMPNLANLDPGLMKLIADADPGNQYGVPWAWGTDGVGYNVQAVKKVLGADAPLDSWSLVFDPANLSKLKSCGVSFLDAAADVFPAALQYMHKDPNSTNPGDYQAAYEMLKKVRPYITQFNSSGYINDLANNDICVALGYSGDVGIARRRASEAKRSYEVRFSNIKDAGLIWMDVMAIPKDAPHPEAAMKWMNYIEDPKVSAAITNEVFYPTANRAARQFVTPAIEQDANVYPPEAVLNKMTLMRPQPAPIMRLENRLWAQLKSGS